MPKPPSKKTLPDIYVFLTHIPNTGGTRIASFDRRYIVIPSGELISRLPAKRKSKGVYSFYFSFDGEKCSDIREPVHEEDYTPYLDNWSLIENCLG